MEDIRKLMRQIKHPEMDLDIVELGMIGRVREEGNKVHIELKLPFRGVPKKRMIIDRIENILGERDVEVRTVLMNRKHKAEFYELAGRNWGRK